ncbi:TetR/AcrR family transcriptional regulator [Allorhizocola rhizosphaerae]|uniref:TetR/AcrR family transcriptional regulator n=1 Tax=Allorhizocola rhizosphaerae TaxID=1872709 RepID=UPI000E3B81B1|nr:TetR/AcrR family transcriptional regulator [Allorhizocola rhizosphaerae]
MTDSDRRVRRTRRTLQEALTSLVLEKSYERITIQDVLDRADVGRSTFYAHFRDKDALLLACFDDVREELQRDFDGAVEADAIFLHAHRHRRVYKALCGRRIGVGGSVAHLHLKRLIAESVRRQHASSGSDLPADAVAEYRASATLGLLMWWVDTDFREPLERIIRIHQRLASSPVQATVTTGPAAG